MAEQLSARLDFVPLQTGSPHDTRFIPTCAETGIFLMCTVHTRIQATGVGHCCV